MDFVLGILTGIVSMLFLGVYLNERDKKRKSGVPKNENPPPPPKAGELGIYIDGKHIATAKPFSFTGIFREDFRSLEQQLQDAVESENWEEAARLRDLINKK